MCGIGGKIAEGFVGASSGGGIQGGFAEMLSWPSHTPTVGLRGRRTWVLPPDDDWSPARTAARHPPSISRSSFCTVDGAPAFLFARPSKSISFVASGADGNMAHAGGGGGSTVAIPPPNTGEMAVTKAFPAAPHGNVQVALPPNQEGVLAGTMAHPARQATAANMSSVAAPRNGLAMHVGTKSPAIVGAESTDRSVQAAVQRNRSTAAGPPRSDGTLAEVAAHGKLVPTPRSVLADESNAKVSAGKAREAGAESQRVEKLGGDGGGSGIDVGVAAGRSALKGKGVGGDAKKGVVDGISTGAVEGGGGGVKATSVTDGASVAEGKHGKGVSDGVTKSVGGGGGDAKGGVADSTATNSDEKGKASHGSSVSDGGAKPAASGEDAKVGAATGGVATESAKSTGNKGASDAAAKSVAAGKDAKNVAAADSAVKEADGTSKSSKGKGTSDGAQKSGGGKGGDANAGAPANSGAKTADGKGKGSKSEGASQDDAALDEGESGGLEGLAGSPQARVEQLQKKLDEIEHDLSEETSKQKAAIAQEAKLKNMEKEAADPDFPNRLTKGEKAAKEGQQKAVIKQGQAADNIADLNEKRVYLKEELEKAKQALGGNISEPKGEKLPVRVRPWMLSVEDELPGRPDIFGDELSLMQQRLPRTSPQCTASVAAIAAEAPPPYTPLIMTREESVDTEEQGMPPMLVLLPTSPSALALPMTACCCRLGQTCTPSVTCVRASFGCRGRSCGGVREPQRGASALQPSLRHFSASAMRKFL
eukprot:TRINITY_DN35173_c0_g1_i1.p1 TRINITY_DN35173_c0_g1~~TRINITY_DN35173_c0_g1_i1.p1  ORF type:complete len:763 (+),score=190.01 TRINITY_DN35173_c0_g1_i1:55-2343(+)